MIEERQQYFKIGSDNKLFRFIKLVTLVLFLLPFQEGLAQEKLFSIERLPFSSNSRNEFSPVILSNGILYCSDRNNNPLVNYSGSQNSLYNLYFSELLDSAIWGKTKIFASELTTKFNDGPATINEKEDIIFFARNITVTGKLRDIQDSSNQIGLFSAKYLNGEWVGFEEFVFNSSEYSIISPSLTSDGKRLYFSSNMEGGYGGFDLYYSDFAEGKWNTPINLGNIINTPEDDSYPFSDNPGKLYFASEGHSGLGGKDIFYSQLVQEEWTTPINMGADINSPADDFGLITDHSYQGGYFSSNRKKSDDIYSFKRAQVEFENCPEQIENKYCFLFYDDQIVPNDTVSMEYEWEFSTGVIVTAERRKQCFPGPGKYSVVLRVINPASGDTINNPSPYTFELKDIEQAYISSASEGIVDESMVFNGLKTNLPNFTITEHFWDFGEGFTRQGPSTSHRFDQKGEYIIKMGLYGKPNNSDITLKKCVSKKIIITKMPGQ